MDFNFLTPTAGVVAALALVPLLVSLRTVRVARRVRARVGLEEPGRRSYLAPGAALAGSAVCLGLAAMQPVVSLDESRRVRTDAEAIFALDTTRSMLASQSPDSPSRLARAKAAATILHSALSSVPVGLASVTDRTLPHLFPSADEDAFRSTIDKAIGIERPPPVHSLLTRVTSLESLSAVATQGFFSPTAKHRVLVVFTDGETLPGTRARLRPLFSRSPAIATVFVHVWDRDERVFRRRTPEPGYRPDPGAREMLDRIAAEIGGDVFDESQLVAVAQEMPRLLGRGPSAVEGQKRRDLALAPSLAAFAFLPLALLLWRRDR